MLGLLVTVRDVRAERLHVCAFSFQGPEEIDVFKDRLPAEDFDVIDLSPHRLPVSSPAPPTKDGHRPAAPWLFDLCRRDVRCDVVLFSAEFAGSFFGKYGKALPLSDMEEASCQARCDGLFHHPLEVFLLGCNTLATKAPDRRTPAQYLEVLLDHGFDQAMAERVVAARYGPLGPSFRESLRRIFMDVPMLYGFASVAPSGEYTAPMLERYFDAKRDYRRYLDDVREPKWNAELHTAFRGTGLVQDTGLARDEPAAEDRDRVCELYDERETVEERLRVIADLVGREDFLSFVPSIRVFIDRHPPEQLTGEDRRIFDDIRHSEAPRETIMRLVDELDVSALQLELAHFARDLGWLSPTAFRTLAVSGARQLLRRPLTSEVVDVFCEIAKHVSLGNEFRTGDLPGALFEDAEGVRLVDCLAPTDGNVTDRLVVALDRPDPETRLWAAYAVSRRLPLPDPVLVRLARELDDPSADLRARLRWIFTVEAPLSAPVRTAVAAHDRELADTLAAAEHGRRGFLR